MISGSSPHTWGIRQHHQPRRAAGAVHPHIRGAYNVTVQQQGEQGGSSPHTWGISRSGGGHNPHPRFIPTYVGHTLAARKSRKSSAVHPHIRGAYVPNAAISAASFGSSPHTWGIPVEPKKKLRWFRFIPTYVGHTCCSCPRYSQRSVHPHIRGAYASSSAWLHSAIGSSPHTWGIQRVEDLRGLPAGVHPHIRGAYAMKDTDQFVPARFIPTYVGHTMVPSAIFFTLPVHPHIRGAYKPTRNKQRPPRGSSPHTWGIRHGVGGVGGAPRFIPTYVGHTYEEGADYSVPSVHPHIRGAYGNAIEEADFNGGSSPHTWGILKGAEKIAFVVRFIPTYVGHTPKRCYQWSNGTGSSPHTWGILTTGFAGSRGFRFIPTYVGHTSNRMAYLGEGFGSSPHTWGIPECAFCRMDHSRFIPTYVGHT